MRCIMAYTCNPVMVLSEDIELIDSIVKEQYKGSGIDIFARSKRKAVIHRIMSEWQAVQEVAP